MSGSDPNSEVTAGASPPSATSAQTLDFGARPAAEGADSAVRVPGYRILGLLGRGGMGVVYKAVQEKANRPVALKMILHAAHADEADQLRFRAEAEAAARLSHPQIVQVYEVGETREGLPFFSQELVAGGSLAGRLKVGPMRASEAAALIEALARAMHYAHERGIVHRDLKPGNILLEGDGQEGSRVDHAKDTMIKNADGKTLGRAASYSSKSVSTTVPGLGDLRPKITDFGLAKLLDSDDGLTHTGAIMGSPAYMAPEQAFGQSKHVGPAADIYALGAILYECLTGRPPFKGATVADTLDLVRTMEPISVRSFVKEIPADLETICLHCLHKEPQRRYPSGEALAEDLRRFREGEPISVRPVGNLERSWRWCKRHPWSASAAAAIVLLLAGIAVVASVAYVQVRAQNVVIEKKREEAESAQKVAKARLEQSLKALGLFATDFRAFAEDALVPGQAKAKMYEALIEQLENQSADEDAEMTEDALRNKAWMYQTMAIVYLDTQKNDKARATVDKGLAATKAWLELRPGDSYALSFHASLLSLKGDIALNQEEQLTYYRKVRKLREDLLGNDAVDQYTPGRSYMQLADTYDKLHEYSKALVLREKACQAQLEKGADKDKLHESFDFWAWTCWKAYLQQDLAEEQKQVLLEKADELSRRTLQFRPGARRTLDRWSGILRELGDRAYNRAKQAEADGQSETAKKQAALAQEYFEKLADTSRRLAVAPELMYPTSNYGRSYYTMGLMLKGLGKKDGARASFEKSRQVREQLLRDYPMRDYATTLRIDLMFSQVALGEYAQAVAAADGVEQELVANSFQASGTLYRLACIYSLSVAAVAEARTPAPLNDADRKLQAEYRDKALTALERSHANGNQDFEGTRMDADLIPIRGDPRFRRILEAGKRTKK